MKNGPEPRRMLRLDLDVTLNQHAASTPARAAFSLIRVWSHDSGPSAVRCGTWNAPLAASPITVLLVGLWGHPEVTQRSPEQCD